MFSLTRISETLELPLSENFWHVGRPWWLYTHGLLQCTLNLLSCIGWKKWWQTRPRFEPKSPVYSGTQPLELSGAAEWIGLTGTLRPWPWMIFALKDQHLWFFPLVGVNLSVPGICYGTVYKMTDQAMIWTLAPLILFHDIKQIIWGHSNL